MEFTDPTKQNVKNMDPSQPIAKITESNKTKLRNARIQQSKCDILRYNKTDDEKLISYKTKLWKSRIQQNKTLKTFVHQNKLQRIPNPTQQS